MKVLSKSLLYIAISSSLIGVPYADASSIDSDSDEWNSMTEYEKIERNRSDINEDADDIIENIKKIGENNQLIKTNSINLNSHLTDISGNARNISQNKSKIDKNKKDIDKNVKQIHENNQLIGTNLRSATKTGSDLHKNYIILLANKESLKTSKESIDTNKESIKNHEKVIEHNKQISTANANKIAGYGADFLAKNNGRLAAHGKDIAANAKDLQNEMNLRAKYDQQIRSDMTRNFAQVRNVIDHNNKIALGGIAQAMAHSALPQAGQGKSSVSIGTGYFEGENAMALGFSKNFGSDHEYTVKASVSMSAVDTAASIGFGYDL
ncbi:MAG: YadA-like family protein [Endozoicomonas sp. (ex Botrylloides leachii)]|nr:YadA-like family protein [Endozoicomonas sp. (ex Botrylloides leachii)]